MFRLRIRKMRRQLAELAVLLLSCMLLIGVDARPGIFRGNDDSNAVSIERVSLLQRKILEDQHTPATWTQESTNEKVQETGNQAAQQKKWEPKTDEKKEWVNDSKEKGPGVQQEQTTDKEQIKVVEEKKDGWHQETTTSPVQPKVEAKHEPGHEESIVKTEQIKVEAKHEPGHEESNAKTEQTKVEEKHEPRHEESNVATEKIKVEEKKEAGHEQSDVKTEPIKVEEKKEAGHEQSDVKTEPIKVEEKKEAGHEQSDAKTEHIKVEEKKEALHQDSKAEVEQTKEHEKQEKQEAWQQKPTAASVPTKVDEPNVKERKEEPVIKEATTETTKVDRKDSESKVDDKKEEKLETKPASTSGKTDEQPTVEKKAEESFKVQQDKSETKTQVEQQPKKETESKASVLPEIDEDKSVASEIEGENRHAVTDLEEDYPDFLDELRNFPERFQRTAESVKDHIRDSGLDKYSAHSKELFNQANQQIQESFVPLLGSEYAPFIAYVVSYGLLLLPFAVVTYLLDRIRARYSLQKILLFVNIYLAAYFAAILVVALLLRTDPLSFFMKYSASSYIFLQLLQGFGYVLYLLLNTADLIITCSTGTIAANLSSVLQWVVVVAVGFHYYVTVFHRAMARKAPLTGPKMYALYSAAFLFLCLFARIERGKKHYYTPIEVNDTTDKKN